VVTRAEHRRSNLLALGAAAVSAFDELGSAATVDDIAERAGVSRRTVFRYAGSKEDLIFVHPVFWLETLEEAVSEVPDLSARERLHYAAQKISLQIDADPEPVKRAMKVAAAHPDLRSGFGGISRRWIDRVSLEVLGDDTDAEARFRARVIGAAFMGVIDAALAEWLTAEPSRDLAPIVSRGLDYLAPILN